MFGSGIGLGEGALAVAQELQRTDEAVTITWLAHEETERLAAEALGFHAVLKRSWAGLWATLRAGTVVVTHGLGDVHRFGLFRATVVNLWHGAPMKKLHFDTSVTTEVGGGRLISRLLKRMYRSGAHQVDVYAAGSPVAAQRLRSAFRVQPGMVRVLGDARLDTLVEVLNSPERAAQLRTDVSEALQLSPEQRARRWVLYAPTWRDGAETPGVPTEAETQQIAAWAERQNVQLFVRSHPLGHASYAELLGEHVSMLPSSLVADVTPVLALYETLITDYSSIAFDFALTSRPIVWFAPDLDAYSMRRGLYEPYEMTTEGQFSTTWADTIGRLQKVLGDSEGSTRAAVLRTQRLAARFHTHSDGRSAGRVLAYIDVLRSPKSVLTDADAVFFESFYGTLATCNPAALDAEIARQYPGMQRFWSIAHEEVQVPAGATGLLVGGPEWHAVRRAARLLIVNDWLRFDFKRRRGQVVLQTWHGTPLKRLALDRSHQSFRTRLAVRRESRRWSALLSQNPHSTETLARSYAFKGPVIETGYPRNDRLANSQHLGERLPAAMATARWKLGLSPEQRVVMYAPTWRDHRRGTVDTLQLVKLAEMLGDEWTILARGHSRNMDGAGYRGARVIDVTRVADINDVLLASDVCITDYSSVMFDATVASIPVMLFVADLAQYRDAERGFTFAIEETAPGPLLATTEAVAEHLKEFAQRGEDAGWITAGEATLAVWQTRFNPHDDGQASARVVQRLREMNALPALSSEADAVS